MTVEEFAKITEIIKAFWPDKFNAEMFKLLWERCGERCTYVEMGTAVSNRAMIPFAPSVADIITSTGEIICSEARKRVAANQSAKRICSQCENLGWVSTIDPDGYNYVFRCHCPAAMAKGLSSQIPVWEEKYQKAGYCRIVYKKVDASERPRLMKIIAGMSKGSKIEDDRIKDEDIPF